MSSTAKRMLCAALLATTVLAAMAASASASPRYAYWGDYSNSIFRTDVETGASALLISGAGSDPNGVSIDRREGRIYWVARGDTSLHSAKLDGSDLQAVDMGSGLISASDGTAIDAKNRRIYWPNPSANVIGWADLDDLSVRGQLNTGTSNVDQPQGIAVDSLGGRVFWTNQGGGSANMVSWASVDDSGTGGDLFAEPSNAAVGVSYTSLLDRLFWVEYGSSVLRTGTPSETTSTVLDLSPASLSGPGGTGYDAANGKLWAGSYSGTLVRSNADGSGAETFSPGVSPWGNIAIGGAGQLSGDPLSITSAGAAPTSGVLKLKNVGDYPLEVYGAAHSGSASIAAGAGCPAIIAAGEFCDLTVTYTPGAEGSASAEVGLQTDAGSFKFPVTATTSVAPVKEPKLTGVRAVKRCADADSAGSLSVGFTSATATAVTASIQRSSTRLRAIPTKCPERAGNTDYSSKTIGKKTSKSFDATAGQQTKTLKQLFKTKKLEPGRYRVLFSYKDASGSTVRKGTWVWALR